MKIVPLKIFKIKKDQMDLLKTKKVNTQNKMNLTNQRRKEETPKNH